MQQFRLAYYAYPIDAAMGLSSMQWLYEFIDGVQKETLGQIAAVQYDPGDAFKGTDQAAIGVEVYNINREAVFQADLVMAFLPAGVPTVGVILELEQAAFLGKTVVIFTDMSSWSLNGRFGGEDNVYITTPDDAGWLTAREWLNAREPLRNDDRAGRHPVPLPVLPIHGRAREGSPRLPSRTYADDAGLDLHVSEGWIIEPGQFADVPCSIAVELPPETWGLIIGRSSTLRSKHLLVHPGVIDAGYRGELFAGVWNMNEHPVSVAVGERLAQLIVLPNLTMELSPGFVEGLSPHPRGEKGFGSTGV